MIFYLFDEEKKGLGEAAFVSITWRSGATAFNSYS